METIRILSTTGEVLFESKEEISIAKVVEQAVSLSVSLVSADLRGANLCNANFRNANLFGADLRGANLCNANFRNANLFGANLQGANLCNANLFGANLFGANLQGANLCNANLRNTNLDEVSTNEYTTFFESLCPSEGSFIGWKKAGNYIVKLLITEDAKRSSATSMKCRCSKAEVLDIQDMEGKSLKDEIVASSYDHNFFYKVGKIVEVEDFDEDRWNECSTGIHFFISRNNAVKYC